MVQRIVKRYSECFKLSVVQEIESGRFDSVSEARSYYDIKGGSTIQNWLIKYGKNHLTGKVVVVQKPNEKNQVRELKKQIAELQQALGKTQLDNVLNAEFLNIACEQIGCDVEAFKKKVDSTPPNGSSKRKATKPKTTKPTKAQTKRRKSK